MFKLAYRYMMSNRKSSIRAIMGIAFSVMLMFSLIQISSCIMERFERFVNSGLRRDFSVYNLSPDEIIRIHDKLENTPFSETQHSMAMIWVGNVYENGVQVHKILGVDGDLEYFKDTKIIEGTFPINPKEICIEKSYADAQGGIKVGESISLPIEFESEINARHNNVTFDFTVSCIIEDIVEEGTYFFTSPAYAKELLAQSGIEMDNYSNSIAFEAVEGEYGDDLITEVLAFIKSEVAKVSPKQAETFYADCVLFNEAKLSKYEEKGVFTSTSYSVVAVSVIIAICMIVFIYNTLNVSLLQKLENIGTMRCIGLNNRQLSQMLLAETLLLANIGAVIGMAAGNLLNYFVADNLIGLLIQGVENQESGLSQNISIYVTAYLLAVISALIACAKLLLRIRTLSPLNITKLGSGKVIDENFKCGEMHQKYYNFAFAWRNINRNFSKSITQIVTVTLSFALCFVICNIFASVGNGSEKTLYDICDYSIEIDIFNSKSHVMEEDVQEISDAFKARKVYWQKHVLFSDVLIKEQRASLLVYSDELIEILAKNLNLSVNADEPFAVLFGDIGEKFESIAISYNGEVTKVAPNGYFSYARSMEKAAVGTGYALVVNEKAAQEIGCADTEICTILLETDEKITVQDVEKYLDEEIRFGVEDMNGAKAQSQKMLFGMVIIAIYIMSATILLSFMIIGNTIRENVVTRKKEFGVMRAIGMEKNTLCKICCLENLILMMISCAVGIVISYAVNAYFTYILFDKVKISIWVYMAVIIVFTIVTETYAYYFMKKYTEESTVNMLYHQ